MRFPQLLLFFGSSLTLFGEGIKYQVERGDTLFGLALTYNTTPQAIKDLNGIEREVLYLGETLLIPEFYPDSYKVQPGDTLRRLSMLFNIPEGKLRSLNRLEEGTLRVGQELQLIRPPRPGETWAVQEGDTLSWLSLKFDISLEELKKINKLQGDELKVGQILTLAPSPARMVEVEKGDNLWKISLRYKVSIEDIKGWNDLKDNRIQPGMILTLYNSPLLSTRPKPSPKEGVKVASTSFSPSSIMKRTQENQPNQNYVEDKLRSPYQSYQQGVKILGEFDQALKTLPALSAKLQGYTIILDPGHGGKDPGAVVESKDGNGNSVYIVEDEYCYDIALRAYKELVRHGADAYLTVLSPDHTIRSTPTANQTFVNIKNEVYNTSSLNAKDRDSVWPVGNAWGLDQRKVVSKELMGYRSAEKTLFISIHADNNPEDGEGSRILFHPADKGKASEALAKSFLDYMGRDSKTRSQDIRVLKENPAGAAILVEVRNLAYARNAWAIRDEELRQIDASRIVRAIISYVER